MSERSVYCGAHARGLGLTLVTNNTREFGRVRNVTTENWTSVFNALQKSK